MVVLIRVVLVVGKITAEYSDGTLEYEEWFEGGGWSVYKERLFGVGGFPFLLSLLVLLYSKASTTLTKLDLLSCPDSLDTNIEAACHNSDIPLLLPISPMSDPARYILGVTSWSWHGEIERDDLTLCSSVMVDLRTREREMRGDGGNHHEKLGLNRTLCARQFTIPIQQVRVPIRRLITLIRSLPNPIRYVVPRISHIRSYPPHCSYPHPPSLSFSSTTLTSLQNTKLSYPSPSKHVMIMSWHWVQHTPSTAYTEYSIHRVQHTPSTAYTEYSIHRVQHTPSPAYTESSIHRVQHTPCTLDCLSSLHSHDYKLTPECSFSFRRASLQHRPPSTSSPWELKGKVALSHPHSWDETNWWMESQAPGVPSINRL